jgi:hypothetical protein
MDSGGHPRARTRGMGQEHASALGAKARGQWRYAWQHRAARPRGGVAQLVERYVRNVEVGGSSPLTSTASLAVGQPACECRPQGSTEAPCSSSSTAACAVVAERAVDQGALARQMPARERASSKALKGSKGAEQRSLREPGWRGLLLRGRRRRHGALTGLRHGLAVCPFDRDCVLETVCSGLQSRRGVSDWGTARSVTAGSSR